MSSEEPPRVHKESSRYRKCKAISSDLIKVGEIELKFENPEIYQLEELLKNDISNS